MTASGKGSSQSADKSVATNRKARRDYHVLQTFEAGIELRGTEVKSVRAGHVSLNESYARVEEGEAFLFNVHIMPYEHGNIHNHDPRRPRRLLLHRSEIHKLFGQTTLKGHALVPLRMYLKRGRVKVELGLCKGKHEIDKREKIKRRTADREAERAMVDATKRRR